LKQSLLNRDDLKNWLHRKLSPKDKLLIILATFDRPVMVGNLKEVAIEAGFRIPPSWNPSDILGKSKGLAIRTPSGWELTEAGKAHLRNIGITKISLAAVQVATDLRSELVNISDNDTRSFIEDAIRCYEHELYRAAVVMSWLAAVHVLHKHVQQHHLAAFNMEAQRVDTKWRVAKTTDDLGRMGENQFLDRVAAISVIGKNVKDELKQCLKLRNGCGHPNSMKIGPNAVAHHLETLLLNVFKRFA